MPTPQPPARSESTTLAIPPTPRRSVAFRRALGRYARARGQDLWGTLHAPREGWNRLKYWLEAVIGSAPRMDSDSPLPMWDAAIARQWWSDARLRQEYEADAVPARAFLVGAILCVLIASYHLVCLHLSSVLTSLSMMFVLVGVALRPAYRCWRFRTRASGSARMFLRHPAVWWPEFLPPDKQP